MPTFQKLIDSVKSPQESQIRRQKLIKEIEQMTGRNLLVYVADIKKFPDNTLNPEDKTGFSDLIEEISGTEVDVMINSPGGFAEVTEVIVGMLRSKFKSIRYIVPNAAKSAATLLVLSGDEILMDHRGELGPIDPQIEYATSEGRRREAAEDILEGFKQAKEILVKEGPAATPAYVPLLNKYTIGLLRGCTNAADLSRKLAENWLQKYMFKGDEKKAKDVTDIFASHSETLSHNRAILIDRCLEIGMNILDLRKPENKSLSEKIWELWCLYELHFERSPIYKVYEKSNGCLQQKQSLQIQIIPKPILPPGPPNRPVTP